MLPLAGALALAPGNVRANTIRRNVHGAITKNLIGARSRAGHQRPWR
jgi:hypothetical protein